MAAVETDLSMKIGEDVEFSFAPASAIDITGWTLSFQIKASPAVSNTAIVTKMIGSGITVVSAAAGTFKVNLASADTAALFRHSYYWEVARTDTGSRQVKAFGELKIVDHVIAFG